MRPRKRGARKARDRASQIRAGRRPPSKPKALHSPYRVRNFRTYTVPNPNLYRRKIGHASVSMQRGTRLRGVRDPIAGATRRGIKARRDTRGRFR